MKSTPQKNTFYDKLFYQRRIFVFLLFAGICSCSKSRRQNPIQNNADYHKEAKAIRDAARPFSNSGHDSLNYYAGQMIALGEMHDDAAVIVEGKVMKARFELRISNYPIAMEISLEALDLAKDNQLNEQLPDIYSIIGNAYKENESYEGALSAAEKGLQASRELNDTSMMIGAMLEDAMFTHSYSMLKNNDSIERVSLHLYQEGLELAKSNPKFERLQIPFLDNLSQHYLLTKDYPKGIHYGIEGARLAKKYGQIRSLTYSFNWLGEIYYYQGNYEKGMLYLDSALQYAKDLNWSYRASEILGSIYSCYLFSGDTKNALTAFAQSVAIRDSLQILKNVQQVGRLQMQYQTGKKDQKIAMLSSINKRKAKETMGILIGLVVFIVLSAFLAFQYRLIKRRNMQINENFQQINSQSEKLKLLMKELHHRVKNNLQVVSSLLSLQSNHLADREALQVVKTGQQRIEAMSLIHRSLYQHENPNMVNMPEYLNGLIKNIVNGFGRNNEKIDLQIKVEVEELDVDIALPLGLIINEWVTNSFKYAFNGKVVPSLHLSLLSNKDITLKMQDNGPGMEREKWDNPQGSFGIKLIKVLNKQIGGKCEMNNMKGTKFIMQIPLNPLKVAI